MKFPKGIFLKNPDNFKFWILIALLVKGIIFAFSLHKFNYSLVDGFWGSMGDDTLPYYFDSIDNFVKNGIYNPDFRMPGYGFLYLLMYFLPKYITFNIIIVLQYLLDALSVYVIAKTAKIIFNSVSLFYLIFFSYLFSTFISLYNNYLSTESLACSFIIFSIYYFTKALNNDKQKKYFFISGLLFAWVIFLKQVYFPIILAFIFILVYKYWSTKKILITSIIYFSITFIVLDSLWVVRNYIKYKKFLPLMTSLYYKGTENSYILELTLFFESWGGDVVRWNPNAEIKWFGLHEKRYNNMQVPSNNVELPSYIYTSKFNRDSLLILKNYISKVESSECPDNEKTIYNQILKNKFKEYTLSIKKEKPFLYYVKSRLHLFKIFTFHSGTYNLFDKPFGSLNIIEKLLKLFYTLLYIFVFLIGSIYSLILIFKFSFDLKWIIALSGIYLLTVNPFAVLQVEYRYLVPAYTFLLLTSFLAIQDLGLLIKNHLGRL